MRHPTKVFAIIVPLLLLSYAAHALIESTGNSEWQTLTEQNFSSEIRLHPHILLMVTIPWSGEARSLMKQLGKLVADQPEKYGHLRLMLVYKNSQKLLATVLGAAGDIALYYYHQSILFKYNGKFAAEWILSSVNYFMSLKSEEVPLKPLNTLDELDFFMESTDKTVLIVELCGWSSKLLHKKDDMFKGSLFAQVDEKLSFDLKNQKGLEEGLSCDVENKMSDFQQTEEFCWPNSTLEEMENFAVDKNLSCTEEEFEQFKNFFSKFELLTREYFLPPERVRFGLISETSLLPYLGVNTMGAWLVILQFNGCPSCSLKVEATDDLRKILQERHSPVMQLDVDGHNLVPAFPANRPSVVLFIDRFSDSPVVREKSKSALNIFRKLAEHYQPSYRMNRAARHRYSQSSTAQVVPGSWDAVVSDLHSHKLLKDSLMSKHVKIKDTMTIVINKDQGIFSGQAASGAQSTAVYDALLDFINKRNLARKKETKVSFLAKENGFQLLSDDFEVQVADLSPYYKKYDQLSDINKHKVTCTGDQIYSLHQQPIEVSFHQNDVLLTDMEEHVVDVAKQDVLKDAGINNQKHLEIATGKSSNTIEGDDKYNPNEVRSSFCHDENSLLEREAPFVGTYMENDIVDAVVSSSRSKAAGENLPLVLHSEDLAGDDGPQIEENAMSIKEQTLKLHEQTNKGSVTQNECGIMRLEDQTFKHHQQPSEDFVDQNDDLLSLVEESALDDANQAAGGLEGVFQKYPEIATMKNSKTDEDEKSCELNDTASFICNAENSLLEQEGTSEGTCKEKYTGGAVSCSSSFKGAAEEVSLVGPSDNFTGEGRALDDENVMNKPSEEHKESQLFQSSFFFIDGGYQLLNSLTSRSNMPSLVLLDPFAQHHYVFNVDRDIDYTSLVRFVEKFLNGSLSPFQHSASSTISTKEPPRPPFVNLDFQEIDAIPRLTTDTFCEQVFGFKPCVTENASPISKAQHLGAAWKKDILVLFGSSWCGFCQRMELLVREVFHAFKYLKNMLKCESSFISPMCFQGKNGDMLEYNLPSFFLMDCSENDCGSFLKSAGRNEYYPELLLYLAQNKSAIPYEGDMLVVNIIKFIVSEGRNSQFLNDYKGYLWKHSLNNSRRKSATRLDSAPPLLITKTEPRNTAALDDNGGRHIVPGSVLSATDKLHESIPFDNSTILITWVDEDQQTVQGIIVNKPISWNVFDRSDEDFEPLKQASLFYGGPVMAQGLPLVSLARKPMEGYTKLVPAFHYGNPVITRMVIDGIKSGDRFAHDYSFFLGYCNWKWDQLIDELAEGAWHLGPGSNQWPHWLDN